LSDILYQLIIIHVHSDSLEMVPKFCGVKRKT
jgi:hypothetical protein